MDLLDSIAVQTYPDIEIIFVVENSKELYKAVEDRVAKDKQKNLKLFFNDKEFGLSANRNIGAQKASGDIIAFVDDDAVLFPRWTEATVKAYEGDTSIIGATGPIIPQWENPSMNWFPKEFYWMFACTYYDTAKPMEVRNGYGTNISFRKEAFQLCGYFRTELGAKGGGGSLGKQKLTSEETEFSIRVTRKTGKHIIYHPNVSVYHKVYQYRMKTSALAWRGFELGYTKAVFNRNFSGNRSQEKVLDTEYTLLKRVFVNLIPGIFKDIFRHPVIAWRKSFVTALTLTSVATGYVYYFIDDPFNKKRILKDDNTAY
jgi:glycosyltransferase involved in cell wall biosynthesis